MKAKEMNVTSSSIDNPKKRSKFAVWIYVSLFLIFVSVVGGVLAYAYRSEIRDSLCDRRISRVLVDDAFGVADCNFVATNTDTDNSEEDSFAINEGDPTTPPIEGNYAEKIFELNNASVVGIGVESGRVNADREVIGSGFVVSSDGLIATNQHVVSDLNANYFVKLPDETEVVEVEEIYRDEVNDIALLKVNRNNLPAVTLAPNGYVLKPGQAVVAIGNPLGELNSTITSGIISGVNRTVEIGEQSFLRTTVNVFEDTIQTDAAINPGNSGGPLFNTKGEVIGINFATIPSADNLSFALPISILKTRISELNEFGRFRIPYIGIVYTEELLRFSREVFVGAYVEDLDPDGSAIDVLEIGDVIVKVDGNELDRQNLASILQKLQIGDLVEFELIRNGQRVIELVEIVERQD